MVRVQVYVSARWCCVCMLRTYKGIWYEYKCMYAFVPGAQQLKNETRIIVVLVKVPKPKTSAVRI